MSNKKVVLKLKEMSAELPPAFRYELRRMRGNAILAKNAAATCEGKPVDPEGWYKLKTVVAVNHYRAMKRIMSREGAEGVYRYMESFTETKQKANAG